MTLSSTVEDPIVAILGCGEVSPSAFLQNEPRKMTPLITYTGNLGQALLVGLLRSAAAQPGSVKIRELRVTVRSARTAQLVQERVTPLLRDMAVPRVYIFQQGANRNVAEAADIVLLGCKYSSFGEVLQGLQGMRHDPRRIIVSMMGGVSPDLVAEAIPDWTGPILHAVCSIAAAIGESITLLSTTDDRKDHAESQRLVTNLFAVVGMVKWLPECQMHAASALGSSSLAFFAQLINGLAEGVAENNKSGNNNVQLLPLETALAIAAQAARGTATLLQESNPPDQLVAQVATKGGATAAGLAVLEKEKVVPALQACAAITAEATAGLAPRIGVSADSKRHQHALESDPSR